MTNVSIIIPCYNQVAYLPKAIASLQAQTLADWECIVVDDGSTDNTAEVVTNASLKDERIRLVQQINRGSASARDAGLREAKGKYIQFLDADDTIAPEKLERQVAQMEQNGLDISYTAFCWENEKGERTQARIHELNLCKILTKWGLGASIPIHSFLYRTEFIRRHQLVFRSECRYREDWKWHIASYMAKPKQAALSDYCGAVYYQNEQGKTGSYIKMQDGNFAFMAYMAGLLSGWKKCLWTYRLSEELWIWLFRMAKYRSTASGATINHVVLKTGYLFGGIVMMPVSIYSIVLYFIKTYIAR